MSAQAGLAGSKLLMLVGAGVTGSVILNNPHLSNIFGEIAKVVIKHLKEVEKEKPDEAALDSTTAALTAQVKRLSQELRQLASSSRPITVVNAPAHSGSGGWLSYVVPVAVVGAAGYGYMWWKGIHFGDLMYVTKRGMANAVDTMGKQMETLSSALANARRHLTGRLDVVSKTLDDSLEIQGAIKQEVTEVRDVVRGVGHDVECVQHLVESLEGKIDTLQVKQDIATQGIVLLCRFVQGLEGSGRRQPEVIKGLSSYAQLQAPNASRPSTPLSGGLKELEYISTQLESKVNGKGPNLKPGLPQAKSDVEMRRSGPQASDGSAVWANGGDQQPAEHAAVFSTEFPPPPEPLSSSDAQASARDERQGSVLSRPGLIASRSFNLPQLPSSGSTSSLAFVARRPSNIGLS